jgi:16S rRNA (uracil1498-N3)-methyltransferase
MLRDLCTIGIRRLIVTPTELGERSYLGATMWRDIRPLLIEGAAQAGVTRLMEVVRCHSLTQGIQTACGPGQRRVLLHPTPHQEIGAALASVSGQAIVLAVGSERGWTEREIASLTDAGFETAGMGERTLRTETAALVVGWMARAALIMEKP